MEKWKPIADFETLYEISDCGRVRSLRNNIILKQSIGSKGYPLVVLCNKGLQKTVNVHRLVATHFIPNPHGYPCINHKNEDKTDNHVSNLEWCSYYYNNTYGQRLTKSALKRSRPVICVETGVIYTSATSASRETGIGQPGICNCCNNRQTRAGGFSWRFV